MDAAYDRSLCKLIHVGRATPSWIAPGHTPEHCFFSGEERPPGYAMGRAHRRLAFCQFRRTTGPPRQCPGKKTGRTAVSYLARSLREANRSGVSDFFQYSLSTGSHQHLTTMKEKSRTQQDKELASNKHPVHRRAIPRAQISKGSATPDEIRAQVPVLSAPRQSRRTANRSRQKRAQRR